MFLSTFVSSNGRPHHYVVVSLAMMSLLSLPRMVHAQSDSVIGFDYKRSVNDLPIGLSDHTANKDNATGLVYIVGGCNSTTGNKYIDGRFMCESLSNALFVFDPDTETFDATLSKMPRERYRHAAVLVNGYLWVHGGRYLNDTVVPDIDVYDVQLDKWSTFPGLPYEYQVSDHGGFPNHDAKEAYFCGGYLADYGTVGTCFSIDTVQSLANLLDGTNSSTPVTTARADMKLRRGDITIGSDANGAIATGGYSNATNWCEPYSQTEMYSFATESWTLQGNMDVARGDNALVELNGRIYVIGGEREIPDICELRDSGNLPGPDQQRLTIDDIEVFDRNGGEWTSLEDLPDNRFRFAAVAYDNPSRIYAFGGQLAYNATCNCTPTTSEVTVYTEKFGSSVPAPTGSDNGPTPTAVSAPSSPTTASAPSSPTPASAPTSDAAKASLLSNFGRIDPIMTAVVLILSIAVVL